MKKIVVVLAFIWSCFFYGQDRKYAMYILDTLCASSFDGRGYYDNGEKRAADFIKGEFQKYGVKPISDTYLQYFNLPVNAITGKPTVKIDGEILNPGEEYLIHPSSPGTNKASKLFYLSKNQIVDVDEFTKVIPYFKNKYVVVDRSLLEGESREVKYLGTELISFLKYAPDIMLNGVIEVDDRLTYTASQRVALRPHIIVLKDDFKCRSKKAYLSFKNEFNPNYQSQNVIGFIEGEQKDNFIYVVGHYDHLGRMGDSVYFPGANDNASGIAMLLSLAKEFSGGKKPKKSIVFVCFGSEEIGLVGSKFYTENPLLPIEDIDFLINLDILGTGDDGIQVVNGSVYQEEFNELVSLNEDKSLLKQIKIRGAACNSDHCFFSEKGVPSFFIYTLGGIAHYHNVYDKAETLPLTEFDDLFLLLKKFIEKR